jgi:hypothetical protein
VNSLELHRRRLLQTLDQLEGCAWGPPTFGSHLVTTCHGLRTKPIGEFTVEDLRIMIGQDIGSLFLVPLALERLKQAPLAEGDFFPGDLLCSVLRLPADFWKRHSDLRRLLDDVLDALSEVPEAVNEAVQFYRHNKI